MNQYGSTALDNAPDPRVLMIEMIILAGGRLRNVALYLGLHRSVVYVYTYKWGLWPVVNKIRREKLAKDELDRRVKNSLSS